jgi:uncharacterized iron-regulated membrane protein
MKTTLIMAAPTPLHLKMRVFHRYLGFFLAGILAVYALSGIIMTFRNTDFLKREMVVERQIPAQTQPARLGQLLGIRRPTIDSVRHNTVYFAGGYYNRLTGEARYTVQELPLVLRKMTQLHKARWGDPLFFLNIFLGSSLLFFILSSFWMFMPTTPIFRKGIYFTIAGLVVTLLVLLL